MNKHMVDLVLFILASPILILQWLWRIRGHARVFAVAVAPSLECECGAAVSLVGIWRCGCGFTYRGHLLRACPICEAIPSVVRCYHCGVTTLLPESPR